MAGCLSFGAYSADHLPPPPFTPFPHVHAREDVDVARERQRVEAMRELPLNQHGVLHIDSLRKQYSPKAVAVHNLSLSLQVDWGLHLLSRSCLIACLLCLATRHQCHRASQPPIFASFHSQILGSDLFRV